jgi:hypothetical protein
MGKRVERMENQPHAMRRNDTLALQFAPLRSFETQSPFVVVEENDTARHALIATNKIGSAITRNNALQSGKKLQFLGARAPSKDWPAHAMSGCGDMQSPHAATYIVRL